MDIYISNILKFHMSRVGSIFPNLDWGVDRDDEYLLNVYAQLCSTDDPRYNMLEHIIGYNDQCLWSEGIYRIDGWLSDGQINISLHISENIGEQMEESLYNAIVYSLGYRE